MAHIVTLNTPSREDWLSQLADVVTDPDELLRLLNVDADENLLAGREAKRLFALRVPRAFIARMEKGNPDDPLLRQVLTVRDEFIAAPGFSTDPLEEQHSVVPGLLHKYRNRALLLVKGGCAVNCRYCFRRHFPYADNPGNKRSWQTALDYIAAHPELDEIIFSGGDPLMAKDHELDWLIEQLEEQHSVVPGLLHKYRNRALLLVKGGCAVNCRYCFRRHFPYADNPGNKRSWQTALDYIAAHPELDEIIFSGGDPLMAKDHELDWLIEQLETIPHVKRLRIHSRLPIVIPARITDQLVARFARSSLQILLVNHINHAREIDDAFREGMARLKLAGVTLLNQSVLLRGVNDNARTLADLSNALFDAGVMPYYLHVLDKVQGAAHFMVSDEEARTIVRELLTLVSGYMVPKLAREIGGEPSKTPIDLQLRQN